MLYRGNEKLKNQTFWFRAETLDQNVNNHKKRLSQKF
ncbi:hypothetical protein Echvi_1877 [Echinicola vietnamensis DSM 17526]|uniref:Uncharacterized protein n=1 Tax=Echinicola vietnamensis (strain DSM 17526 / LMG 23754 / KMM 6221) TaxID=926556 RepID=L0FXW6_ECHVK|nr:hypothetical protein Echvi_1877 [Echinicola vietnamensis DSM 17526]